MADDEINKNSFTALHVHKFVELSCIRAFVGRIRVIISVFGKCTFALIELIW